MALKDIKDQSTELALSPEDTNVHPSIVGIEKKYGRG